MEPDLDVQFFARLLALRVSVAGSGAFRARQGHGGAFEATCVLPGSGDIVKLWEDDRGQPFGQMFYPQGRPLSSRLPLSDKMRALTGLTHNVDAEIILTDAMGRHVQASDRYEDRQMPTSSPLPAQMLEMVDRAVASSEQDVVDAVETLYHQGRTLELPDLCDPWHLPQAARSLVQACLASQDARLVAAATGVMAADAGQRPTNPSNDTGASHWSRASIDRWSALIGEWTSSATGPGMR